MRLIRSLALSSSIAWLGLASCTEDPRVGEAPLVATETETCVVPVADVTADGDPTVPDGYDPEDDGPLTPDVEEDGPVQLSENAMLDLAAALGANAKASPTGLGGGLGGGGDVVVEDAPGCNGYPDTVCTTHCCALHDICYDKNNCTWKSWCGLETAKCAGCNVRVAQCILRYGLFGCQLGTPKPCSTWKCGCNQHECYDAKTKKHYCAAAC